MEYLRTLEYMAQLGWSRRRLIPHGGHQMSLNIAAGLQLGGNESYPDVFQPFSGFADHTPVRHSMLWTCHPLTVAEGCPDQMAAFGAAFGAAFDGAQQSGSSDAAPL